MTRVRATFVTEGVTAIAELSTDAAPTTIAGVIEALPREGEAVHGIYSGSEIYMLLDPGVWLPAENATIELGPGALAYGRVYGGRLDGFPDDLSELLWIYDDDGVPSMPDGPMPVNLIGRFNEGWEEFAAVSRAMRREGAKQVRFELVLD